MFPFLHLKLSDTLNLLSPTQMHMQNPLRAFPFLFMASGGLESLKQHQPCVAAALSLNCDFTVLIRAPIKAAAANAHSFRIFPFPPFPTLTRENKWKEH
jgi:hypothetical protein